MPFNMFEVDMSSLNVSLKKVAKDVMARDEIEPPTQDFSGPRLVGPDYKAP